MVDLISQHQKIREELDQEIANIIDNAAFIKGAAVNQFENNLASYLGCERVIACGNGTDALQAAFMALNLPEGSEVIVPDFTFIATAEVLALLNLTPVFVDVKEDTFNLDPEKIEAAITEKTRAIVPVHMFGLPCEMERILEIASANNLFVIEDTAQGMGASYTFSDGSTKKVGTMGHLGCTSFFPSKNLSCMGDGGAIYTNDAELGQRVAEICNHGMSAQYSYAHIGINSRLDGIQAAILNVKLKHLDEYNDARRKAAATYSKGLSGIEQLVLPIEQAESHHIFHQYTLKIMDDSRDALMNYLSEKDIPTKIYYPIPFHAHDPYNGFPHDLSQLETSIWLSDHVLSLPMHTELDDEQLAYIIDAITEFYN